MNADLRQGSGKSEEQYKVLKRTFEQYKVEAADKLKVTSLTNCNGDHLLRVTLHVKQTTHRSCFSVPLALSRC